MSVQRPLSPHLQVYQLQLTSTLSILHRITGLWLCLGSIALICWIVSLAAGPEAYAGFDDFAHGWGGKVVVVVSVFALCYHLLKTTYASGYAVVAFAIIATGGILFLLGGAR